MRNPISEFHPLAVFLYFMTAVGITLLWNRPGLLLASFLIAFGYACALEKGKNILRSLVWLLPVTALPVIINPLVNHRGNTPVLYINDQPITLEAVLYGLFTGLMIAAMLFWFQAYSKSLDSDGFLYLFGGKLPSIALMVTMIFRFIPQFHRSLQEIEAVQKTLGAAVSRGTIRQRLQAGEAAVGPGVYHSGGFPSDGGFHECERLWPAGENPVQKNPVCLAGWSAFGGLFGRIGVLPSSFWDGEA